MAYTYNQILKKLEDISLANPFIKRWGAGEIQALEMQSPTEVDFPYAWAVPQTVEIGENTLSYKFRLMVFDIDSTSDKYQQEILSDTLRTLIDIIKTFRYDGGTDYTLNDSPFPTATPFTHQLVDYVVGWYADIDIITDADNSPCDIP